MDEHIRQNHITGCDTMVRELTTTTRHQRSVSGQLKQPVKNMNPRKPRSTDTTLGQSETQLRLERMFPGICVYNTIMCVRVFLRQNAHDSQDLCSSKGESTCQWM